MTAERIRQITMHVELTTGGSIQIIYYEDNCETGEVHVVRSQELTTSVALQLAFELQAACEQLLQQHNEHIDRMNLKRVITSKESSY